MKVFMKLTVVFTLAASIPIIILRPSMAKEDSVIPRDPVTKRFVYVANTTKAFPHCFLREDPRTTSKSPWLRELQQRLELALTGRAELLEQEPSGCVFDLSPAGQIIHLRAYPENLGTDDRQNNRAVDIIKGISPLKPLQGELAAHNNVTIFIQFQFKSDPNCTLRQVLTPR